MHTIKVKVSIDCSAIMPENAKGLATTSFDMTYNIDITDEQWKYLRKEEDDLELFEEVDFKNLRPDFQEMADRLTRPYIDFIYQQFLASGNHPSNIERYLESMECTVCHEREDDDDDDDEFDNLFKNLSNMLASDKKFMAEKAARVQRAQSYDDIYRAVPQMVESRKEEDARNFLTNMAIESSVLNTPLGSVLVVHIPTYTTPSGLVVEYLALARQAEQLAYFTIENDEGQFFLDKILPERHATYGVQWATAPTMQQIAERVKEIMDKKAGV